MWEISVVRSGTDIVITYAATDGKTYRLKRKFSLTDATWTPLAGFDDATVVNTGPTQFVFADPEAVGIERGFYRVRLLP